MFSMVEIELLDWLLCFNSLLVLEEGRAGVLITRRDDATSNLSKGNDYQHSPSEKIIYIQNESS